MKDSLRNICILEAFNLFEIVHTYVCSVQVNKHLEISHNVESITEAANSINSARPNNQRSWLIALQMSLLSIEPLAGFSALSD